MKKILLPVLLAGTTLVLGAPSSSSATDAAPGRPTVTTKVACPDLPGDRWASCDYRVTVHGTDRHAFVVKVGGWTCRSRFVPAKGHRVTTCRR